MRRWLGCCRKVASFSCSLVLLDIWCSWLVCAHCSVTLYFSYLTYSCCMIVIPAVDIWIALDLCTVLHLTIMLRSTLLQ